MTDKYYLQSPRDQLFYRVIIFMMCLYGVAKNKWWGIKFHPIVQLFLDIHGSAAKVLAPTALVLLAAAFMDYDNLNFDTLGIMFSILPVALVVFIKMASSSFTSYEKLMCDLIDNIHLHSFYMREKDNFIKLTLIKAEKYTRLTFYFLGSFLLIDVISWAVIPIIKNTQDRELIMNRTVQLQTCLYFWTPFDYYYNYNNWIVMHFISSYLISCGCSIITIFDTINFAFVFHLIGHIKILKHTINVRFAEKNMSDEEHKMGLIEVIKIHNFIVNTFDEMQSAYGINVAGNYLQNLLEDSLLLYELMFAKKGDKILFGIMAVVYIGELIIMSFILEEVRRQSEDLSEVLYCIPWENMSISNQKIFKLVLLRVQPTLSFKAACDLKAGINPMISILKSTFSYYVMLKSNVEK